MRSRERIVGDRSVADDLCARLTSRASSLVVGDPRQPSTQIGPMINAAAVQRVAALVEDARDQGATLLCGGEADGLRFAPTVLSGVTPSMRLYGEESFGPVVTVVPVDGADEAVRVAKDTECGLAGAVLGRNVPRAFDVARRLETGICHVNGATVHDEPQMPFGGVNWSGFGRFGGRACARGVHGAALDHGRWAGGPPLPDLEHRTAFRDKRRSVLPPQYPTP